MIATATLTEEIFSMTSSSTQKESYLEMITFTNSKMIADTVLSAVLHSHGNDLSP